MSCCPCLLYDRDCLYRYANFQPSVQEEQLLPHLTLVHEVEVIPQIGEECYVWLCEARASEAGFNEIQQEFFTRLLKWIALATRWRFLKEPGEIEAAGYVQEYGMGFRYQDRQTRQAAWEKAERDRDHFRNELFKWLDQQSAEDIPCRQPCADCCDDKRGRRGGGGFITSF